jgi:hypothetical protein
MIEDILPFFKKGYISKRLIKSLIYKSRIGGCKEYINELRKKRRVIIGDRELSNRGISIEDKEKLSSQIKSYLLKLAIDDEELDKSLTDIWKGINIIEKEKESKN